MKKIVENAEKYNYLAFLVNLGILALLILSMIFDLFGVIKHMSVGSFLKFAGTLVSTIVGGVVVISTVHMVLWCTCNYYRKATGTDAEEAETKFPIPGKSEAKEES